MKRNLKSANHKLYFLSKVRKNLDNRTTLNLFKTMVLPYLEFANTVLIGCTSKLKKKAQRIQNKGLRFSLQKNRYYSTELIHKEAKMELWETRALLASNRLMFKYKQESSYLLDHNINTRQTDGTVYFNDRPNSSMYRNCVSYLSRKSWNELPSYLRTVADYDCFKVLIKGHYRSITNNN